MTSGACVRSSPVLSPTVQARVPPPFGQPSSVLHVTHSTTAIWSRPRILHLCGLAKLHVLRLALRIVRKLRMHAACPPTPIIRRHHRHRVRHREFRVQQRRRPWDHGSGSFYSGVWWQEAVMSREQRAASSAVQDPAFSRR
jgi:hypothetical protein